ncbi:MAG TPA: DUF5060 domain-containing protein [Chloroflexota bacterium]|nr:DUF5060 domain-containing protein [Chloroflexota bacterium]
MTQVNNRQYHPCDLVFRSTTSHDNPFFVDVRASLEGPDGRATTVPGFYDGDGTWIIRVCPNAVGTWRYHTQSDDPQLDGQTGEVECVPNTNPRVHGALKVDPAHPHHFIYEDGHRPFVLGYEANWLWALGFLEQGEEQLRRFTGKIAAFGFNHVFVNTYAHDTRWCQGTTSEQDYGPPPMYAWAGSNEEPDHLHLNIAYWRNFDVMMQALLEQGLTAHLFIKVYNKMVNWPEPRSLADDLFFKYVVARYQGYSNVVWDFSKESKNEPDKEYLANRLALVRTHDGYRRLVTTHDDDVYYYDPQYAGTTDFVTDQYHRDLAAMLMAQRLRWACPIINEEFAYECGPSGLSDRTYGRSNTAEDHALRSWEVVMGGGYPGYYYTYTAWDVIRPEDEPPGYAMHQHVVRFMTEARWWELQPHPGVALANNVGNARCLANPGKECVIFTADGGTARVTLPGFATGDVITCEWMQVLTGERKRTELVATHRMALEPPVAGPYAVRITPAQGLARN